MSVVTNVRDLVPSRGYCTFMCRYTYAHTEYKEITLKKNKNKQTKTPKIESGDMAQQLRALDTVSEDLGSIFSTYIAAHNCVEFQFQGI